MKGLGLQLFGLFLLLIALTFALGYFGNQKNHWARPLHPEITH